MKAMFGGGDNGAKMVGKLRIRLSTLIPGHLTGASLAAQTLSQLSEAVGGRAASLGLVVASWRCATSGA